MIIQSGFYEYRSIYGIRTMELPNNEQTTQLINDLRTAGFPEAKIQCDGRKYRLTEAGCFEIKSFFPLNDSTIYQSQRVPQGNNGSKIYVILFNDTEIASLFSEIRIYEMENGVRVIDHAPTITFEYDRDEFMSACPALVEPVVAVPINDEDEENPPMAVARLIGSL